MAVPHLDCRVIDERVALLFGPFAAWTTKFLRNQGKWTDLPGSVNPHNIGTLVRTGCANIDLIKYLFQQGMQSMDDRMAVLRLFYPAARTEDWSLVDAGIRVQAIRITDGEAGIVHYGTEVLTSADRSLATLLGASPGASVAVDVAIEVVMRCLPDLLSSAEGKARIEKMVPSFNADLRLASSASRFGQLHARALQWLQLK
jgi:malate dehydrogenase (quinone)